MPYSDSVLPILCALDGKDGNTLRLQFSHQHETESSGGMYGIRRVYHYTHACI
jgi:hypothetical protein